MMLASMLQSYFIDDKFLKDAKKYLKDLFGNWYTKIELIDHFFFACFANEDWSSMQNCAIELNILSNEDMEKLRNKQMFKNESDSLRIKMALGIINFCVNMLNIQGEATKSALKFLLSSVYKRKCNINLSRESSFTENDESVPGCSKDSDDKGSSSHRGRICEPIAGYSKYTDESPKGIMLSSIMKEPKMSAAENTIISEVETNDFDDIHFDLDTFVNQDEDFNDHYKECRKIDFLTLMDIFRDDESNE